MHFMTATGQVKLGAFEKIRFLDVANVTYDFVLVEFFAFEFRLTQETHLVNFLFLDFILDRDFVFLDKLFAL